MFCVVTVPTLALPQMPLQPNPQDALFLPTTGCDRRNLERLQPNPRCVHDAEPRRDAGYSAAVTFSKCKGNLEQRGVVAGVVKSADGTTLFTISGSVMASVQATPQEAGAAAALGVAVGTPVTVFTRQPDVPEVEAQYYMTRFAIGLNDPFDACATAAAPTDSRRRPDMRFLENAQYEAATQEKLRLEDVQRKAAAQRLAEGQVYAPRWFARAEHAEDDAALVKRDGLCAHVWHSTGEYWQAREAQQWTAVPDIWQIAAQA